VTAGDGVLKAVTTSGAPGAIGPYSQAIRAGDFLFASGQIPLDVGTGQIVPGGIAEQTHQVLKNLGAVLSAAGASYSRVVKTTVYLADMGEFAAMNDVYGTYFPAPAPARATIQAARLPRDVRVEIDLVAYLGV
jgi:2-iminobutanoate/2-iminopropanoate deaminase